jgi:hypothetical protein
VFQYRCFNPRKRNKNSYIKGKELKTEEGKCDRLLNTIANNENASKKSRYCPIEKDYYGSRKRNV